MSQIVWHLKCLYSSVFFDGLHSLSELLFFHLFALDEQILKPLVISIVDFVELRSLVRTALTVVALTFAACIRHERIAGHRRTAHNCLVIPILFL